jgi:hypothetical protein
MHLTLDAEQMRACMDLWRGALRVPARSWGDEQQALLARVTGTVSGWSDLLRLCRPDAGQEKALQELSAEVRRFNTWIDDAALATKLAVQINQMNAPRRTRKRASLR